MLGHDGCKSTGFFRVRCRIAASRVHAESGQSPICGGLRNRPGRTCRREVSSGPPGDERGPWLQSNEGPSPDPGTKIRNYRQPAGDCLTETPWDSTTVLRQRRATERGVGECRAPLLAVFEFATRARETFVSGTPVQQRMILEAAGLNYTLTSRKVALMWNQPLTLVTRAAADSTWSALLDDVRTLIVDQRLDIGGFERALRAMDGIMPELAEAA